MAYNPTIDETRWASVGRQWLVWRRDAELRAQLCKTERLPEPLPTRVLNKLHSLDDLWKIACDYRADHKGPSALKTPTQARKRGPKAYVSKRVEDDMTNDLQQEKIKLTEFRDMSEIALEARYGASRDTVRRVRNKILSKSVDNSNSDK